MIIEKKCHMNGINLLLQNRIMIYNVKAEQSYNLHIYGVEEFTQYKRMAFCNSKKKNHCIPNNKCLGN